MSDKLYSLISKWSEAKLTIIESGVDSLKTEDLGIEEREILQNITDLMTECFDEFLKDLRSLEE